MIHCTRLHPAAVVRPVLLAVAGLVVAVLASTTVFARAPGAVELLWLLWFVLAIWTAWKILAWWQTYLIITGRRLIRVTGLRASGPLDGDMVDLRATGAADGD